MSQVDTSEKVVVKSADQVIKETSPSIRKIRRMLSQLESEMGEAVRTRSELDSLLHDFEPTLLGSGPAIMMIHDELRELIYNLEMLVPDYKLNGDPISVVLQTSKSEFLLKAKQLLEKSAKYSGEKAHKTRFLPTREALRKVVDLLEIDGQRMNLFSPVSSLEGSGFSRRTRPSGRVPSEGRNYRGKKK